MIQETWHIYGTAMCWDVSSVSFRKLFCTRAVSCHGGVKEVTWTQRGNQKDEGIRKNLSPRMISDDCHQDDLKAIKQLRLCLVCVCVFVFVRAESVPNYKLY